MLAQPTSSFATRLLQAAAISLAYGGSILAQKPAGIPEAQRYVYPSDAGLLYQEGPRGDRIPDSSVCGYRGGGVAVPDAPVKVRVSPAAGDNTARIQAAIDYVPQLPPDGWGIRGPVLVPAGRHFVWGSRGIQAS